MDARAAAIARNRDTSFQSTPGRATITFGGGFISLGIGENLLILLGIDDQVESLPFSDTLLGARVPPCPAAPCLLRFDVASKGG